MKIAGAAPVHDAVCVGHLVEPRLLETKRLHVVVETQGTHTVGRTVMDVNRRGEGEPNCDVAFHADAEIFIALMMDIFKARLEDDRQ